MQIVTAQKQACASTCRILAAVFFVLTLGATIGVAKSDPKIPQSAVGATIEDVRVDVKGVADRFAVMHYLSAQKGMKLQPGLIEADYRRLVDLGYYRVGVTVENGDLPNTVIVHWTVGEPWLRFTANTRYSNPLVSIRKGAGFTLSGKQFSSNGSYLFFQTWLSAVTHDFAAGLVSPLNVSHDREQDLIVDAYADFEANQYQNPTNATIYNKTAGLEAAWLVRTSGGTRYGVKIREEHATSAAPSGIESSSVLPINGRVVKSFLAIAGLSHYCYGLASVCPAQYRLQFTDGIGAFGSASTFQMYVIDLSRYYAINSATTFAFRASTTRTGGTVPEQNLPQLDELRGYKKPFYGTDIEVLQVELRLNDMRPRSLETFLFTETGGYRFRNGVGPYNPQTFTFNADSGIGFLYRGIGVTLAHGNTGYVVKVILGPSF